MNVMKEQLIEQIISLEWEMMISITAIDDPDGCMGDSVTFRIMRTSQHEIWSEDTLESYLTDLDISKSQHVNMMAERYANMMKVTSPEEYEAIKDKLRHITVETTHRIDEIMSYFTEWTNELDKMYSNVRAMGRPATEDGSWTAVDTYLIGELLTYSIRTLNLCLRDVKTAAINNENLSKEILQNMAYHYGFSSLDEMEVWIKNKINSK